MPKGSDEELLGRSAWHAAASWPGSVTTWEAALLVLGGG